VIHLIAYRIDQQFYSKSNQMHNFRVYWLSLHLVPASKQSANLYDIYLVLCVESWTPDDGRKDRLKRVEWYSINSKIVRLVGFTIEIYHDARLIIVKFRPTCYEVPHLGIYPFSVHVVTFNFITNFMHLFN